ncbi:MAG: nitroreductase family protein [bacterium]
MKKILKKFVSPRKRVLIKTLIKTLPERLKAMELDKFYIQTNGKLLYELRRATHRLEKSLTFEIRKVGGGINITQEILELLKLNEKRNFIDNFTLNWTKSVLIQQSNRLKKDITEFQIKDKKRIINSINKIETIINNNKTNSIIEQPKLYNISSINNKDLLHFFSTRHSVRSFKPVKIESEKIYLAVEIAKLTPTPCNKQSVKVSIIQDTDIIIKVLKLQGGIVGYEEQIFNLAVISTTREAYPGFYEKHSVFTEGALFGMNFIWGLHSQNISTVVLNWIGNFKKTKKLNDVLNLNKYYQPVFMVAFGYFKENVMIPTSPRQTTESFINIVS